LGGGGCMISMIDIAFFCSELSIDVSGGEGSRNVEIGVLSTVSSNF